VNRKIAIVVPTLLERPIELIQTLESVLASELRAVYVVSPHAAPDWLPRHIEGQCVWVRSDSGLVESLNYAFSKIPKECEYLTWLGDDDLLIPNNFKRLGDLNGDLIVGHCHFIDHAGRKKGLASPRRWRLKIASMSLIASPIAQPATIFSRALYDRLGGLSSGYKFAFDFDFFFRAIKSHCSLEVVAVPFASYRVHDGTLSQQNWRASLLETAQIRRKLAPRPLVPLLIVVEPLRHMAMLLRSKLTRTSS
jgi:hypothetical protein